MAIRASHWKTPCHVLLLFLLPAACGPDIDDLPNIRSARGTRIVCLGDSLTAGSGLDRDRSYPAVLSRVLGVEVVNAGVKGDTTRAALRRFDRDVAAREPAVVVICLGGNDGLRRLPQVEARRNLLEIVERIIMIGAVPVIVGFDMGLFAPGYTGFLEQVADQTGAMFLDGALDDVLRDPSLKIDAVHPNAAGYALLAERLAPPLRRVLETLREHQS